MMKAHLQPLPNTSPISKLTSLAHYLRVDPVILISVAEDVDQHWRPGKQIKKPDGSVRVTNSCTPELKRIHKAINREILGKVKYPDYLFGALKNNSDGTGRGHMANAKLHQGKRFLISADIAGFFPSVNSNAIRSIWQGFFPFAPEVAEILTRLTSYKGELPQGWGCSSYLAQLVFWDCEYELFNDFGERGIIYSRYIDDFTLSTNRTLPNPELDGVFQELSLLCLKKGTRLKGQKCKVEARNRTQNVNKLSVHTPQIKLAKVYRKNLRARVHQFGHNKTRLNEEEYKKELQSIRGQVTYLKKFHPKEAVDLLERL